MIRHSLAIAAALALSVPPVAHAAEVEIEAEGPVIELSVYESVSAEPEIVTVGAGVTTQAPTAVEAMRQNAAQKTRVIDRIRSLGVPDRDIQTTGINLNAQYDYDRANQQQVFRGYQVSNRVSVKLRDIEAIQARSSAPMPQMRALAAEAAPATPVQPGQVSTGVSVSIKYEMVSGGSDN